MKKRIILILMLCMAFIPANASGLVRMDIKKTSDNSVDLTFFTTETGANPMVTRKSGNKYVILMPSVSGKNAGKPDLTAVKDMVTGIDIKNVDDGMSGYTKVTLITTKPINIKTHIQKTAPLTKEENAAKTVIAQAKTKQTPTVAKAPQTQQPTKPQQPTKTQTPPQQTKQTAPVVTDKISQKPAAPQKVQNSQLKNDIKEIEKSVKNIQPQKTQTVEPAKEVQNINVNELENIEKSSAPKKSHGFGWMLLLLPILGLYMLIKYVRNSVQGSIALKASFKENLAQQPVVSENYDDIINDSQINWQTKYKKFVEESKNRVNKYKFITGFLSEIDKKRLELENTLGKTPEVYKQSSLENEIPPEVKSEDDVVSGKMLKAFAKPVNLHSTYRGRRKPLTEKPRVHEGKFVKLRENSLNMSRRNFSDANLKVSDLIRTSNNYLKANTTTSGKNDYVMSSVEEYFSILDSEQSSVSQTVKALAKVKPSMQFKNKSERISNPIAAQNNSDYTSGLIVKSGYSIDDEKGFYLVNLDGVSALIGRIKDDITVIKKFDKPVDKLQVRPDSENVYMVKAGDFKSLIDVTDTKMGVLIEL